VDVLSCGFVDVWSCEVVRSCSGVVVELWSCEVVKL